MWVPKQLIELFELSKSNVEALREELSATKVERDTLRSQLQASNIMNDWMRHKVNQLEMERTGLLEKAYGIKIPTPEIVKQPMVDPAFDPRQLGNLFQDMGDELAKEQGLPPLN